MKGGLIKRINYMSVFEQQAGAIFTGQALSRVKAGLMKAETVAISVSDQVAKAMRAAFKRETYRMGNQSTHRPHQGAQEMARRVRQMRTGHIPRDQIRAI